MRVSQAGPLVLCWLAGGAGGARVSAGRAGCMHRAAFARARGLLVACACRTLPDPALRGPQAADQVSKIAVDTAKEVSRRGTMEADKASEAVHEGAKKVRAQRADSRSLARVIAGVVCACRSSAARARTCGCRRRSARLPCWHTQKLAVCLMRGSSHIHAPGLPHTAALVLPDPAVRFTLRRHVGSPAPRRSFVRGRRC